MQITDAIELAGGTQAALRKVFEGARIAVTKQAVSQWVAAGRLPDHRILQLRMIRPAWFARKAMATRRKNSATVQPTKPLKPASPKPRVPSTKQLERARTPRLPATKISKRGPPFRPKNYGDPETQI